jgi:hypothetical protein
VEVSNQGFEIASGLIDINSIRHETNKSYQESSGGNHADIYSVSLSSRFDVDIDIRK